MPQMAPLSWLILYISFSTVFIMFNIMNYYSFSYTPITKSKQNKINCKILEWKW